MWFIWVFGLYLNVRGVFLCCFVYGVYRWLGFVVSFVLLWVFVWLLLMVLIRFLLLCYVTICVMIVACVLGVVYSLMLFVLWVVVLVFVGCCLGYCGVFGFCRSMFGCYMLLFVGCVHISFGYCWLLRCYLYLCYFDCFAVVGGLCCV